MIDITIEPMRQEHLDGVYEVECESFSIPWSKNEFRKELDESAMRIYFVALHNGEIVGYAGMWHIVNEGHVTNIAVKQEYRRMSIGSRLLNQLLEVAREREMIGITLEVRVGNANAQKLYFKNGFEVEGFRKNYYSDTKEDAIIMWKYLQQG